MNIVEVEIYPNLKKTFNICKAKIRILSLVLFTSASIEVQLFDENDRVVDSRNFFIKDDEYIKWNDDNYLIDLIKTKLQEESSSA